MFTVLDRISRPGRPDKPNEDICGVSGDWAWVIDTSIFPGTRPVMHDKSDAAIAKLLGTSRGTIAVSLYRSRARLRKLMRASSSGDQS